MRATARSQGGRQSLGTKAEGGPRPVFTPAPAQPFIRLQGRGRRS